MPAHCFGKYERTASRNIKIYNMCFTRAGRTCPRWHPLKGAQRIIAEWEQILADSWNDGVNSDGA